MDYSFEDRICNCEYCINLDTLSDTDFYDETESIHSDDSIINDSLYVDHLEHILDLLDTYSKNLNIEGMHRILNAAIFKEDLGVMQLVMLNYMSCNELNCPRHKHLYNAIDTGSLSVVTCVVDYGIDIEFYDYKREFIEAAERGYLNIVKYLYEQGIPINYIEDAISSAAFHGHYKTVKFLLNIAVTRNLVISYRKALELACEFGHQKTMKYLLKYYKGDLQFLNTKIIKENSVLYGDLKFIEWFMNLLNITENLDKEDMDDTHIISDNDININSLIMEKIRYLHKYPIDIINQTTLYHCCRYGYLDGVKYLLAKGIDIHGSDDYALRLAIISNRFDVANYLLLKGANAEITMTRLPKESQRIILEKLNKPLFKGTLDNTTETVCYICHDDMNTEKEMLVQCKVCKKCVHLACQNKWKPECVFCRN